MLGGGALGKSGATLDPNCPEGVRIELNGIDWFLYISFMNAHTLGKG